MAQPRLTAVQQDVIDRLADDWELVWSPAAWRLVRSGEPARWVDKRTAESIIRRGLAELVGDERQRRYRLGKR